MKPTIAFMFVGLLIAPMASAGQQKPLEWQEVQKLKPGTEIALTVKTGDLLNVCLLFADETLLVTLKFTPVTKLERLEQFLYSIGPRWLNILGSPDYKVEQGPLRVSQDGLFDRDKKLAGLAELVEQTPRAYVEVLEAAIPKPQSYLGLDVFGGGVSFTKPATDTEPAKDLEWGWEAGATPDSTMPPHRLCHSSRGGRSGRQDWATCHGR